jgi:glycosyltransferase involved in cell wall biosynthesis
MRVFMLASTLVTGGAERVFESLALGLPEFGFEPEVLCLHDPGRTGERIMEAEIPVRHGLLRSKYDPFSALSISRILSEDKESLLLCLDHHDAIAVGIGAARLAGVRRRVLSVHSTGLWGEGGSFNRLDRLFLGGFDRIVALAELHKSYLLEQEGIDPESVRVINNGVDTELFSPPDDLTRARVRDELDIGEGVFAVAMVAAMRPEKNHQMILRAAAELRKKAPGRYVFLLAGTGAIEPELRETAAGEELGDTVRFLGDRSDIDAVLKGADASVLCSFPVVETFPLSVLEAMATGLPVISTGVGSVPEIIENGVDGLIIDSEDIDGLVKSIESLEIDRERAAGMGALARAKAEDRFSVRGMVSSYAEMFGELI